MTKDEIKTVDNADPADTYTETEQDSRNRAADILTLRRTAAEARRHNVVVRVISVLLVVLIALVAIAYAVSYFMTGSEALPLLSINTIW